VLLRWLLNALGDLGDLTSFTGRVFAWAVHRPGRGTLLPVFYAVGVRSIPVVAVTGLFIGMVLAVQSYDQFAAMGLQTRLGGVINVSVIRELGPVLAATMLAGRIGSAIAAELATMRITEQIDALSCLGANPIHYLAVPRFLACLTLIPLLTVVANFMGVMGGAVICVWVYHVACYRGFTSRAGAEGVGRAATESFVSAFVAILGQDFLLAMFLNQLHDLIWPSAGPKMF
jgi:phospholipid/cholesterol/gamma-HCH transport system permease protein